MNINEPLICITESARCFPTFSRIDSHLIGPKLQLAARIKRRLWLLPPGSGLDPAPHLHNWNLHRILAASLQRLWRTASKRADDRPALPHWLNHFLPSPPPSPPPISRFNWLNINFSGWFDVTGGTVQLQAVAWLDSVVGVVGVIGVAIVLLAVHRATPQHGGTSFAYSIDFDHHFSYKYHFIVYLNCFIFWFELHHFSISIL